MTNKRADAPRLRAYWTREAGFNVVAVSREDIQRLGLQPEIAVPFDITHTPLADVAKDSTIIAAYARKDDSGTARLVVLRDDRKDAPDFVNADLYTLTLDLLTHPEFPRRVEGASTCCNENMATFAAENGILAKHRAGDGFRHRWPFVPSAEQVFTSTGDK